MILRLSPMAGTMLSLELLLHITVNPQEDVGLLCEVELTFVQNVIRWACLWATNMSMSIANCPFRFSVRHKLDPVTESAGVKLKEVKWKQVKQRRWLKSVSLSYNFLFDFVCVYVHACVRACVCVCVRRGGYTYMCAGLCVCVCKCVCMCA